jgi:hypothetical protein
VSTPISPRPCEHARTRSTAPSARSPAQLCANT